MKRFSLEREREDDGRWLAEVSLLPGVLAHGASANEAMAKAEVLALRVLAEQLEHAKPCHWTSAFPFQPRHEPVAFVEGQASLCRAARSHRQTHRP